MTPIILVLLAVMWAAVLLPPYLRSRGVSAGGAGGALAAARERLSAFGSGASGYLPVAGDLGPQQQAAPLPHGARYPVGAGPKGMRPSTDYKPSSGSVQVVEAPSNAISILGPAGELVDPDPTGPRATVTELRPRQQRIAPAASAPTPEAPAADGSFVDEFGVVHHAPTGAPTGAARVARPAAPRPASGRRVPPEVAARRAVRKRRRDVFHTLLGATGATLVLSLIMGTMMFLLFLLSAGALGAYVVMLLKVQKAEAERDIKVAFLPHGGEGVAPSQLLRQAGESAAL